MGLCWLFDKVRLCWLFDNVRLSLTLYVTATISKRLKPVAVLEARWPYRR